MQFVSNKVPRDYALELRAALGKKNYDFVLGGLYEVLNREAHHKIVHELLYLKVLTDTAVAGKDLLFFRSKSSRNGLINDNLPLYEQCLDETIQEYLDGGARSLLAIMRSNIMTMPELYERQKQELLPLYLDGDPEEKIVEKPPAYYLPRDHSLELHDSGVLFDVFVDPVLSCRKYEPLKIDEGYQNLWTQLSPERYDNEVKGQYKLVMVNEYQPFGWNHRGNTKTFLTTNKLEDLERLSLAVDDFQYTGRTRELEGVLFYEFNANRLAYWNRVFVENPLLDEINSILRDAENLLRQKLNVPLIGEGWVSEVAMYHLIKQRFDDAVMHSRPEWLKPQHLDVFVPSRQLAFEYQGRQHYEPVEFFGGEEAHLSRKQLDRRKLRKCRANGVPLIYWRYDEPITSDLLEQKLREV